MTYTQVWDHMTNKVSDRMIKRDEDGAFIPFDDGNTDYVKYKAWLDEGNEPTPATQPSTGENDGSAPEARYPPRPERGEEHSRATKLPDARSAAPSKHGPAPKGGGKHR